MRSVFEIIEEAKGGGMPSHEECYWAMLALDAITTIDKRTIDRLSGDKATDLVKSMSKDEVFRRWKQFLNADPKAWLGPNHDPSNPECQRMRKIAFGVMKKVEKDKAPVA